MLICLHEEHAGQTLFRTTKCCYNCQLLPIIYSMFKNFLLVSDYVFSSLLLRTVSVTYCVNLKHLSNQRTSEKYCHEKEI